VVVSRGFIGKLMTDYITKQPAKQAEGTFVGHIKNGFLDRLYLYSPSAITVWLALANRADSGCRCYPSISTIQGDTGLARASIYKGIKELVSKGEISVVSGGGKGNLSNHYQIIGSSQNELVQNMNQFKLETKVVQTIDKGGPQNELKPDSVTRLSNQTHSSCRKLRFDKADMLTAQWMFSLIQDLEPGSKKPNYQNWANTIRLLRERDNRTDASIREVFAWANRDSFWQANILSPSKLREKFSQLLLRMKEPAHGKSNSKPGPGQRHAADTKLDGF
jgi:hypothetical protein